MALALGIIQSGATAAPIAMSSCLVRVPLFHLFRLFRRQLLRLRLLGVKMLFPVMFNHLVDVRVVAGGHIQLGAVLEYSG